MSSENSAVLQPYIHAYYADNAKKLHRTVDEILRKFGGLSGKDMDDFYSLANEVFVDAMKRYDHVQPFDGFLYACLSNKIMTEITRRNREKRKADRMAASLDAINGDDEQCNLLELIPSDFDTFEEAVKEQDRGQYCDKFIPASDEPSAALARAFGECREGQIPRSSLRIKLDTPSACCGVFDCYLSEDEPEGIRELENRGYGDSASRGSSIHGKSGHDCGQAYVQGTDEDGGLMPAPWMGVIQRRWKV